MTATEATALALDRTYEALDRPGGPLHVSGLPECDGCRGEIQDDEQIRSLVDPGTGRLVGVCDHCALTLIARTLDQCPPRDHAESTAREVLRTIAAEHTAGLWRRG